MGEVAGDCAITRDAPAAAAAMIMPRTIFFMRSSLDRCAASDANLVSVATTHNGPGARSAPDDTGELAKGGRYSDITGERPWLVPLYAVRLSRAVRSWIDITTSRADSNAPCIQALAFDT